MRLLGWVVVGFLSLLFTGSTVNLGSLPDSPPPRPHTPLSDPVIRLRIIVDDTLAAIHGDELRSFVAEMVAIHNIEWRRLRREWFTIEQISVEPAAPTRDASWLLADLVQRTAYEADVIHVRMTGGPLEVYSNSRSARPIGGLAYRASDVVLISAARGVNAELAAYYLFHEIGHCWEAFDLPFGGGHSTFGSKRFATFTVDAGNGQIIEDSPGPQPRDTPWLAPAAVRAKAAAARKITSDPMIYRRLRDLLLHEPSASNPEYVAKRAALLDAAGTDRAAVLVLLKRYEITPQQIRADAEVRQDLAEQYWIASDAIARGDLATANEALAAIHLLHDAQHGDARLLVAAVGRKVRRARR